MCYYMKNHEITRFNLYCHELPNEDVFNHWKRERKDYIYKNFPKFVEYEYIEKKTPEAIFLLLKNTKNFIYYYIRKEFEMNLLYIHDNSFIDSITYKNEITYQVQYYFRLEDLRTKLPSYTDFIRATLYIELLPSRWIDKCLIELIKKDKHDNKIYLVPSTNSPGVDSSSSDFANMSSISGKSYKDFNELPVQKKRKIQKQ